MGLREVTYLKKEYPEGKVSFWVEQPREWIRRGTCGSKHVSLRGKIHGLLLKNPENLDPQRNGKERLEDALRLNQPLATVN